MVTGLAHIESVLARSKSPPAAVVGRDRETGSFTAAFEFDLERSTGRVAASVQIP
ncbi:MAG: hypothetical protein ACYDEP_12680 [Acidimicrobiales bacterium]